MRIAMPGHLRTNRSRTLPTKSPFICARVQDARFCHVSPEPIRGMQRCSAASMRAAAMEESGRGVIGARGCRLRGGIGDRPASYGALSRGRGAVGGGRVRPAGCRAALVRTVTARARIRTAALSARQTRGWCRYALRRSGAAHFGCAVRWNTEAVGRGHARSRGGAVGSGRHRLRG